MSERVTAEQLAALARKYRTLMAMREVFEGVIARGLMEFPADEKPSRRAAMKAIAMEFPGALRELDEAPMEELRARAEALERGARALWMDAAVLFHWALREALQLRRGLLQQPSFWREERDRALVMAPPTGRLLDVVWTAVAAELGLSPREAERLVYPKAPPRGTRV